MDSSLPTIKEGSTGNDVLILQQYLQLLGYSSAVPSGSFGPVTRDEVKLFQKDNGLKADGIVGPLTWEALLEQVDSSGGFEQLPYSGDKPFLEFGNNSEYVSQLQQELKTLGYYSGNISTYFDDATLQAVEAFQLTNKLTPDGKVGSETWSALEALWAPLASCAGGGGDGGNTGGGGGNGSNYINHTVVAGDTLWKLAQQYGTTVDAIRELNNLTSDALQIGQVIKIPTGDGSSGGNSGGSGGEYINHTVVSGDTLWKLAQQYGTTVDAIRELNNLTSDALQIGQVIKIPTGGGGGSDTKYINHTVVSGDTLWKLAKQYGTTVEAIRALNNLKSDALQIGQVIKIPVSSRSISIGGGSNIGGGAGYYYTNYGSISGRGTVANRSSYINHTVVSGDTLWKLAKQYGTTVEAIRALNNLKSDALQIGQVIKIPTGDGSSGGNSGGSGGEYINHTVVSGDTLWKLAKRYGTTVEAIRALNNLKSDALQIGQVIKIPVKSRSISTTLPTSVVSTSGYTTSKHVVKFGDTLSKLAKNYKTTVNEIKYLNNLTSNNLKIGQTLLISSDSIGVYNHTQIASNSKGTTKEYYTVKSGDSLWLISKRFKTTIDEIVKANNLTSSLLSAGQILVIPTSK